jgi:hypothetical protein
MVPWQRFNILLDHRVGPTTGVISRNEKDIRYASASSCCRLCRFRKWTDRGAALSGQIRSARADRKLGSDLALDLDAIRDWGAAAVVTLLEPNELNLLRVPHLGHEVGRRGSAVADGRGISLRYAPRSGAYSNPATSRTRRSGFEAHIWRNLPRRGAARHAITGLTGARFSAGRTERGSQRSRACVHPVRIPAEKSGMRHLATY